MKKSTKIFLIVTTVISAVSIIGAAVYAVKKFLLPKLVFEPDFDLTDLDEYIEEDD